MIGLHDPSFLSSEYYLDMKSYMPRGLDLVTFPLNNCSLHNEQHPYVPYNEMGVGLIVEMWFVA